MKSIYARRGVVAVGDRRRPETLGEKFARWARNKLRSLLAAAPPEQKTRWPSWMVEEHSGHQRQSTRPGTSWQRKDTRPPSSQRDDVDPYTDA